MSGISRSQVSRLCEEIDGKVKVFLERPIEGDWPFYLWIDATYLKARRGGRIVSVAVIIAVGVNSDGRREALAMWRSARRGRAADLTEFLRKTPRPARRQARRLRRTRRHKGRRHQGVMRNMAALPRPLHAQRARPCRKERAACRLCLHRYRLRPGDAEAASAQWRAVTDQIRPSTCHHHDTRPNRRPGLHDLPQRSIAPSCTAPIRSSVSMVRSSGAPMWSASSPMTSSAPRRGPAKQNDEWAVQRGRYMTLETIALEP